MRNIHLIAAFACILAAQPALAATGHKHYAMAKTDVADHSAIPQHTAIEELNQRSMAKASHGGVLTRSEAEKVAIR